MPEWMKDRDDIFGMTEDRQYRNIEADKLRLSDNAIEILASEKLNN